MGFWDTLLGKSAAPASSRNNAVNRLLVLVETPSNLTSRLSLDAIEKMKSEVLHVVNRYIASVSMQDVHVSLKKDKDKETLEMNIDIHD